MRITQSFSTLISKAKTKKRRAKNMMTFVNILLGIAILAIIIDALKNGGQ